MYKSFIIIHIIFTGLQWNSFQIQWYIWWWFWYSSSPFIGYTNLTTQHNSEWFNPIGPEPNLSTWSKYELHVYWSPVNPMTTTCWLVKRNILSFIKPIREDYKKNWSLCGVAFQSLIIISYTCEHFMIWTNQK